MSRPLVSICIPAYNSSEFIKDTIDSILNQSYKNIELIIVDDNSSDDTFEIISEYAKKDSRVKIFKNEENLGMSGNWNKCLSLCEGEFMKLVCADDKLTKECIKKEVYLLEKNPSANMICSDTKLEDVDGKPKGYYKRYKKRGLIEGKEVVRKGFFSQNYFGAPQATTFRRSAYKKTNGIDPFFTYIVDYDFLVSLAMLGDIYILHEPLNIFCVRNDSNTGNVMGGDKEKLDIYLNEHYHLFSKHKQELDLSDKDIKKCMLMRRLRCFAAFIYLKTIVRK